VPITIEASRQATSTSISTDNGLTFCCGVGPAANLGPANPMMDPFPALGSGSRFLFPYGNSLGSDILAGQSFTYYPRDLKLRADINRWLLWEAAHWFPSCYIYLVENVVKPLLKAEPDRAVTDKEAPNWHRLANILDERLAKQRWLCGDKVTLADIAVAAPMHLHSYQKLPLDAHPNLKRWMTKDVEQLPCWKATDAAKLLGLAA
jgi:hypothetical protein